MPQSSLHHWPPRQAGTSSTEAWRTFPRHPFWKPNEACWLGLATDWNILCVSLWPGEPHSKPESFRTLEPLNPTELFIPAVPGLHTNACCHGGMSLHILILTHSFSSPVSHLPIPTPLSCQSPGLCWFSLCLSCLSLVSTWWTLTLLSRLRPITIPFSVNHCLPPPKFLAT